MENFYLLIILCVSFCGGYFLMKHVDCILQNDHDQWNKTDSEYSVCVFLENDLTEDEIVKEIKQFKENYKMVRVCLYTDCKKTSIDKQK